MSNMFEGLFVLELSTMHKGSLERGLRIINEFSKVVRKNSVKAAIKLQFRDSDNFVHKDFLHRTDIRYINSIVSRKLSRENYKILVEEIKKNGLLTAVTPFDEESVRFCGELDIDIIKIASSDINDWNLLSEVVKLDKPTILSTGGAGTISVDDVVNYLKSNDCTFAINSCSSIYPTAKEDIQLNQVEFLKVRYSDLIVGFSSHIPYSEELLMSMAYLKSMSSQMYEFHIDINSDGVEVSPYCLTPSELNNVLKMYQKTII